MDSKLETMERMLEESSDDCEFYESSYELFCMKVIQMVNIIYIDLEAKCAKLPFQSLYRAVII